MVYYHDLVTQKSWDELQVLNKAVDFVLIGGWAAYLYTKTLKSKDIDIIVDYDQLPILKKHYLLNKNTRLKKYEAVKAEVEIDIYLPYYSEIGIPVEDLLEQKRQLEGFTLVEINYLLVLKIYTLAQRGRSPKGQKDFLDVVSLLNSGQEDLGKVKQIMRKYGIEGELKVLQELLTEYSEVLELGLNKHRFARLRKDIVGKLSG